MALSAFKAALEFYLSTKENLFSRAQLIPDRAYQALRGLEGIYWMFLRRNSYHRICAAEINAIYGDLNILLVIEFI